MPKLVDYSVRFELIREAVVRVAASEGGRAVNLSRIAAELQVSTSTLRRMLRSPDVLAECGVVWVARLRDQRRFRPGRPKGMVDGSPAHARWLLWKELPLGEQAVEGARAWAALAVVGAGGRIDTLREEHDRWLDRLVEGSVAVLGIPTERRELEAIRLRALVDGVVTAICAGRITREQLEACVSAHLDEISPAPTPYLSATTQGRNSAESPNSCQR